MSSDETVLVTKETLDDAILKAADVLEMDVPVDAYTIRFSEEEEGFPRCRLDVDRNTFHMHESVLERTLYHEAAHWVLVKNGHEMRHALLPDMFYARIYQELFADLTVMHICGDGDYLRSLSDIRWRLNQIEENHAEHIKMRSELDASIQEDNLLNMKKARILRTARNNIDNLVTAIAGYTLAIDHITFEKFMYDKASVADSPFVSRRIMDIHRRLLLHPDVMAIAAQVLAERGAYAHYKRNQKPQNILNGWLAMYRELEAPYMFSYVQITAKSAREQFDGKAA